MKKRLADKVIIGKRATSQSNAACGLFEKKRGKNFLGGVGTVLDKANIPGRNRRDTKNSQESKKQMMNN